jgi:hypothetical protein
VRDIQEDFSSSETEENLYDDSLSEESFATPPEFDSDGDGEDHP